ncbi:MAG: hypothetical protein ACRDNJ_15465, partial [Solirubrobacteraceae bacterium]
MSVGGPLRGGAGMVTALACALALAACGGTSAGGSSAGSSSAGSSGAGSSGATSSSGASSASAGTPVTGGILQAGEATDPDHLDPAFSYTTESWEMLEATNDGLVRFAAAAGGAGNVVVPDLASAMPTVSDGGRTYT